MTETGAPTSTTSPTTAPAIGKNGVPFFVVGLIIAVAIIIICILVYALYVRSSPKSVPVRTVAGPQETAPPPSEQQLASSAAGYKPTADFKDPIAATQAPVQGPPKMESKTVNADSPGNQTPSSITPTTGNDPVAMQKSLTERPIDVDKKNDAASTHKLISSQRGGVDATAQSAMSLLENEMRR